MNDRELLKLAEKAAVIKFGAPKDRIAVQNPYNRDVYYREWNPLEDDGDALRLAVKLDIDVWTETGRVYAGESWMTRGSGPNETLGDDPCSAWRRAIVRAAAAMGEA